MSADQAPGRPTEQEWVEAALADSLRAYTGTVSALAPLIDRVVAAARAEGAASVAGPVLALADEWAHPSRPAASTWQRQAAAHLRTAIPTEPSEALAQVKAEAWDEGYTSGHSNAMRRMSDEPNAPTTPNPYRIEAV